MQHINIYQSVCQPECHSVQRLPIVTSYPLSFTSEYQMSTVKLRESCESCASCKVKCTKEKPSCSRCVARGLDCQYGESRRCGRASKYARKNGDMAAAASSPRPGLAKSRSRDRSYSSHSGESQQGSIRCHRKSRDVSRDSRWSEHTSISGIQDAGQFPQEANLEHDTDFTSEMCMPLLDFELDSLDSASNGLGMMDDMADSFDMNAPSAPLQTGVENCCLAKGLALMQQITHGPRYLADSTVGTPAISVRGISGDLCSMLQCACATREELLTLVSMVLTKLINWCNDAIYVETAASTRGPNAILEDLYGVQELVNQVALLSEQSCAGRGVVFDLRQNLRASSIEIVRVLLRMR